MVNNSLQDKQLIAWCIERYLTTVQRNTKYNVESPNDESTKRQYRNRLQQILNDHPITDTDDIKDSWTKIKTNILPLAEETTDTRKQQMEY